MRSLGLLKPYALLAVGFSELALVVRTDFGARSAGLFCASAACFFVAAMFHLADGGKRL